MPRLEALVDRRFPVARESPGLIGQLRRRGYSVQEFDGDLPEELVPEKPAQAFILAGLSKIQACLAMRGARLRLAADYPCELHDLLRRQVWRATFAEALASPIAGVSPLFVKIDRSFMDANNPPYFSGVVESLNDLRGRLQPTTRIVCSEVVCWVAEWRFYICCDRIVGFAPYQPLHGGRRSIPPWHLPDRRFVEEAVERMRKSSPSPRGYVLDVGQLKTGETAVVELNDGFALRNYGISESSYLDVLLARWRQLEGEIQ